MELQLFGINHKTTKLSERELFIINDSNQEDFKNFFQSAFSDSVDSFFALSTCNRTEVYIFGSSTSATTNRQVQIIMNNNYLFKAKIISFYNFVN